VPVFLKRQCDRALRPPRAPSAPGRGRFPGAGTPRLGGRGPLSQGGREGTGVCAEYATCTVWRYVIRRGAPAGGSSLQVNPLNPRPARSLPRALEESHLGRAQHDQRRGAARNLKFTGLTHNFPVKPSSLTESPSYYRLLKLTQSLGQPCEFYLRARAPRLPRAAARTARSAHPQCKQTLPVDATAPTIDARSRRRSSRRGRVGIRNQLQRYVRIALRIAATYVLHVSLIRARIRIVLNLARYYIYYVRARSTKIFSTKFSDIYY
jgi:hypothetical protein